MNLCLLAAQIVGNLIASVYRVRRRWGEGRRAAPRGASDNRGVSFSDTENFKRIRIDISAAATINTVAERERSTRIAATREFSNK